jgi:alkanesulfonate monooxygenase SsuD/methylene tetrahydromethanopterin reductase-like flavin-dependent oxidoreductase (luciferase family)
MNQIGRERGWAPQTRDHFEYECGPTGAIGVGSPQEVTEKIIRMHETMKMDRFMMQLSIGYLPHKEIMKAIELYGNVVAPKVREHVGVKAGV